jgi:hypothetical protein
MCQIRYRKEDKQLVDKKECGARAQVVVRRGAGGRGVVAAGAPLRARRALLLLPPPAAALPAVSDWPTPLGHIPPHSF